MLKRRVLLAVSLIYVLAVTGQGQTVQPISIPHVTFVDGSGSPCSGCKLYSYSAGTTTPEATFTDAGGVTQNTNPILLDAAGGATIWMGAGAYKFMLEDALGATIWTVDQVNSANLFPCLTANAVQIANSAHDGLACDSTITVDTAGHALLVGKLQVDNLTINALGTPTTWTLDVTSAATAAASLGITASGNVSAGTIGQVAVYAAAGTTVQGATAIPNGITATTQAASDTSAKLATTAYVAAPGVINPTSVQVASGAAVTDNQGNGAKLQHSTGTAAANNCAKFDANGNTVDAGFPCASLSTVTDYYWSFTSCANLVGQPIRCTGTMSLPGAMPDASYQVGCLVNSGSTEPSDQLISLHTLPLPTASGGSISYAMVQVMQNGTVGGLTFTVMCHAHHS